VRSFGASSTLPKKIVVSRLTRWLGEAGRKMQASGSETLDEIVASRASMSARETGEGESWPEENAILFHPCTRIRAH
jgi:hypothetical protein